MAMTFSCHGPQGSRRRGKEKPDKKEIFFGLPYNSFLIHAHPS